MPGIRVLANPGPALIVSICAPAVGASLSASSHQDSVWTATPVITPLGRAAASHAHLHARFRSCSHAETRPPFHQAGCCVALRLPLFSLFLPSAFSLSFAPRRRVGLTLCCCSPRWPWCYSCMCERGEPAASRDAPERGSPPPGAQGRRAASPASGGARPRAALLALVPLSLSPALSAPKTLEGSCFASLRSPSASLARAALARRSPPPSPSPVAVRFFARALPCGGCSSRPACSGDAPALARSAGARRRTRASPALAPRPPPPSLSLPLLARSPSPAPTSLSRRTRRAHIQDVNYLKCASHCAPALLNVPQRRLGRKLHHAFFARRLSSHRGCRSDLRCPHRQRRWLLRHSAWLGRSSVALPDVYQLTLYLRSPHLLFSICTHLPSSSPPLTSRSCVQSSGSGLTAPGPPVAVRFPVLRASASMACCRT